MAEERTLDQHLIEAAEREGGKRLVYWLIGGGIGVVAPILLIIIAVIAGLSLLAGIGQWAASFFGPSPPTIATPMSRPDEWLSGISRDAAGAGIPNVLAVAVVQQASGGQAYGDRYYCSNQQSAGEPCTQAFHPGALGIGSHNVRTLGIGRGLFGLQSAPSGQNPHSVTWNLSAGTKALAHALGSGYWESDLTSFHAQNQIPSGWQSSSYASQIKSLVQQYDAGPHLGAWALASWSHKTGAFQDPGNTPEWVLAVGSAPIGARGSHAWKAPTARRVWSKSKKKFVTKMVPHNLHYKDLGLPYQVWGTTKNGRTVQFKESVSGSGIPRWPGALVWGGKVPLTGPGALKTITARWTNGQIDTVPWPETSGNSTGTTWHLLTNPQALKKWWPDIQKAARQAGSGIPRKAFEDAIGATMLHESGGNPGLYANGDPNGAYGLMQLEPATAKSLPGYYPGARHNPQENLTLGAELLANLYRQTGSWHMMAAAYYVGSPPSGWHRGMPWSAAQRLLNYVPSGGNVQTVAGYADETAAEMKVVAKEAP